MRAALHALWQRKYIVPVGLFWGTAVPIFINDNILEINFVTGASMAPTLSPTYEETSHSDGILWKKWKPHQDLKRGDVIQFMNPHKPEAFAVKRVIGLEGDVVVLDKRRRPSVRTGNEPPESMAWDAWKGKATVPEGHIWVEGDNWRASKDSNWYGAISKSLINGTTVSVVWPLDRFWTKPWDGFKPRTKVIQGDVQGEWTNGLPVELAEIGEPHLPR